MFFNRVHFSWFLLSYIFIHVATGEKYWKTKSNVLALNPDALDYHVGGKEPVLVEFYTPWCGHCKRLKSTMEKLADTFASLPVKIVAVDCGEHPSVKENYPVKGYPTVLYFPADSKEPEKYEDPRDLASFIEWINVRANTNAKESRNFILLNEDNFDIIVMDPERHVFVNFCMLTKGLKIDTEKSCRSLHTHFDRAAGSFKGEDITFAFLNAVDFPELARKYSPKAQYPNLLMFKKDKKRGTRYDGNANVKDENMVKFVNEQTGSQRLLGGGLLEGAGTISELNEFAKGFAKAKNKEDILKNVRTILEDDNKPLAKVYLSYMEGIISTGVGFLYKESYKLKKIIKTDKGDVLTAHKKLNILKVFKKK